jgi:RNA polymerase sigma-70 factor (ECF subfamily)
VLTLDQFLASVERKAYRMALMAVKCEADALDIVQDSMIKMAQNYGQYEGTSASEEWRPLFYTILHNCLIDFHRKQSRWRKWFSRPSDLQIDSDDEDPGVMGQNALEHEFSPEQYLESEQLGVKAVSAIELLPLKQQQCFLLRSWEGFSVKETANMMKITPGSVKTHHFRALQKIQQVINEQA